MHISAQHKCSQCFRCSHRDILKELLHIRRSARILKVFCRLIIRRGIYKLHSSVSKLCFRDISPIVTAFCLDIFKHFLHGAMQNDSDICSIQLICLPVHKTESILQEIFKLTFCVFFKFGHTLRELCSI